MGIIVTELFSAVISVVKKAAQNGLAYYKEREKWSNTLYQSLALTKQAVDDVNFRVYEAFLDENIDELAQSICKDKQADFA